jgi:spermidine synthase
MAWYNSIFGFFSEKVVYRTGSQFNPILEVVESGNHLQLDTPHVNYSFGELHRSFQQLFRKMDIVKVDPKSVLILGFGAGSIASILQNEYKLSCTITGVEIDPEVIALGRRFFETYAFIDLTIKEVDAFLYMEKNHGKFDLVVVDLYLDMEVPLQAETLDFAVKLKDALTKNGQLVFNKFVYNNATGQSADQLSKLLYEIFGNVNIYKTGHDRMNRMIVCKNAV